ncbi:gliding motility-associated C-terminal domain-containing protein [Aequorivita vladivostokensis]|uniref:PKD domain-containing protein n=1 Tax=Aequorivita vladivostokensis TaxID=171194 RepID=A0ABR5DI68_9FLAO|nr:T9SS C-terminal target domain-containing protein [Aequorivita vladivostokensis]KJJ38483.1 hypothetical protein MB09_07225 [Aequorivita vladivostokensis]MAB58484.1 T9SS C-terminal target domain-containing protein [Aequorivita sp.]MBF29868.1 T9SS C-terminal target domain-containing protein [Aequorivita sp.]|tara:strand:- start:54150 stop:56645 length:2496 start_codon:yes stop_codon:yes gene_type:complete
MNKKLPLYLQSCRHYFRVNFNRNALLFISFITLSFTAVAQGPGCPNVYAGEDVELDCGTPCTDLTASFLNTGETTSYDVSSIPYDPPFPFTGGTSVSVNTDDVWSPAIQLPFDFCFFGETYTEMVIGSNAVVSFDLVNNPPNGYCSWSFDESVPDPNLFFTAIFGPYMDVDPSVSGSGQINWAVFGEAPCRTMVVNFPGIPYFSSSCNQYELTSQIVIYETTNVVEIYVEERTDACSNWNDGNAVIGIQNQDGTQGYTPPNRNTGNWSATEEAWRFTPNGTSNVVFSWLDDTGTVISNDPTITVCPTDPSTTYTAQAVYTNCNGDVITEIDEVTVTSIGSFLVDLGEDQELCEQSNYEITAVLTGADPADATFLWNTGETTQSITVSASGTYTVEVTVGSCTVTQSVTINFNDRPLIDLGQDISTCFFEPVILDASPSNYDTTEVTFIWSLDGTILTNETNATLTVTQYGTYSVTVSKNGCEATDTVVVGPQTLQITLGDDFTSCFNEEVILVSEAIDFDPTLATYEWALNGTTIAGETQSTLTITETGTYTVTAFIGECMATDTIVVSLGNVAIDLGDDFQTCFDQPVILDASPSNYNPEDATYQWSLNGTILAEESATLTITEIGTYSVTVSIGSCSSTDEVTVSFRDDLEVNLEEDFQICANEPRILTAATAEEGASFQWFLNGSILTDETANTLEINLEPGTMGIQTYSVVITVGGCSGTESVDVSLYPIGNCVISQGLSPNGDGFNDTLDLTFLKDRSGINKLQIFNRLGTMVFEQNNYTNEWRGQTNDGEDLPTGTYFYVIDLAGNDAVYGSQATGWIYLNQEAN